METVESWEMKVTKLNDELSKMSGRICLLENFIKEQFGNIFWNFCEKAAAAITTPPNIASFKEAPPAHKDYEKYSPNLRNNSLLKSNQPNFQPNDNRRKIVFNNHSSRFIPKVSQKTQHKIHHYPNPRLTSHAISGNGTTNSENSSASALHPKLHHQLTVARSKMQATDSSVSISSTKIMLSNVSLPPSITITSVQEPKVERDSESMDDLPENGEYLVNSSMSLKMRSPPLLQPSPGTSKYRNNSVGNQQSANEIYKIKQSNENACGTFYSEIDCGMVKAEHGDSYSGVDSVNEEDEDGPCAMEIRLDPTVIDFSDEYGDESEDYEQDQSWGDYKESSGSVDGRMYLEKNAVNLSSSGSSINRTPTRPRRDVMQPTPCHAKCQNKCAEWSHEDRLVVFNSYTALSSVQHKEAWIMSNLERTEIAKKKTLYSNFRTCTFKYYLPHPTCGLRQVCKAFFCATIGEPRNIVEKTAKALKISVDDTNGVKEPIPFARRVPEKRRKPNSCIDFSSSVSGMISNIKANIKSEYSSDNSVS